MAVVRKGSRFVMRRRGVGSATSVVQNAWCNLFPDYPGCNAIIAAQDPNLAGAGAQPSGITPPQIGLPVGYNPTTGTIAPSNTTGVTLVSPATIDVSVPTDTGDGSSLPWYCSAFGIACPGGGGTPGWMWAVGLTLGGFVLLNALGGRR